MRPKGWRLWRHRGPGVRLTFDDGPHPAHTPAVLDRLARYGVSATFYLVGRRVADAPAVPRMIVDAGHAVGNHTFWHGPGGSAWRDIGDCQRAVRDACGVAPAVFRPPLGRLRPPQLLAAAGHRLGLRLWSLDSHDWRCRGEADADRCAAAVLAAVRPGDVLLFHDDHRQAGRVLDAVLPGLAGRGLLPSTPR